MKLDELAKKYGLLIDEEGNYYRINKQGERQEPFATVIAIAQIFSLHRATVLSKIEQAKISSILLKNHKGRGCPGYNINSVKKACTDLLNNLPAVDENNTVVINGRQFACPSQLGKILNISPGAISRRIKLAKLPATSAKDKLSRLTIVYDVEIVKGLCADLLNDLPLADKDGLVVIDGRQFACIEQLGKILNISQGTISRRIKLAKLPLTSAKYKVGHPMTIYEIEIVKEICSDLLNKLPVADNEGIVVINGRRFAAKNRVAKILGISERSINNIRKQASLKTLTGKSPNGNVFELFDIELVQKNCPKLKLPQIDSSGIVIINDRQFACVTQIEKQLGIFFPTISRRIKKAKLPGISAKNKPGKLIKVYDIAIVKGLCADLLENLPTTDSDNIVTIDGQQFATLACIAKKWGFKPITVAKRVKKAGLKKVKARGKLGQNRIVYKIKDVQQACADLLEKKQPAKT